MKTDYFYIFVNYLKLLLGLALILIPLSMSILIISFPNEGILMLSSLSAIRYFFGSDSGGGASNTPIMFGLMSLAGAFLLNSLAYSKKQN